LAYAKAKHGDLKKAIALFSQMITSQETIYGVKSREHAETSGILGFLYLQCEDYEGALTYLSAAHKWQLANMGPASSPACLYTKEAIKTVESNLRGASVWV
jgi:hypothetical protein